MLSAKRSKNFKKSHAHEDLRYAFLRAALDQASSSSPDDISFRELARKLGVTSAAPYYHFRDRAELLLLLAIDGFSKLLAHLQDARAKEQTPSARSEALVRAFLNFGRQQRGYYAIMVHREVVKPGNIQELEGPAAKCFDLVCETIHEANPRLKKNGVSERAVAVWSFLHGVLQLSAAGPLGRRLPPEHEDRFAVEVCRRIVDI
jgi:AcrR family transcriptional regulator